MSKVERNLEYIAIIENAAKGMQELDYKQIEDEMGITNAIAADLEFQSIQPDLFEEEETFQRMLTAISNLKNSIGSKVSYLFDEVQKELEDIHAGAKAKDKPVGDWIINIWVDKVNEDMRYAMTQNFKVHQLEVVKHLKELREIRVHVADDHRLVYTSEAYGEVNKARGKEEDRIKTEEAKLKDQKQLEQSTTTNNPPAA